MSEQKNNQPKAQGEQGQQKRTSRWQRKGQYKSEPKKKDAEAIPILKYGPSNNFGMGSKHVCNQPGKTSECYRL